jgi:hypothetical protein
MLPDEIANYVAQLSRVLKPGGQSFSTLFLFDAEARTAVEEGLTIFDFRQPIGPCLTFNPNEPDEGIACDREWFLHLVGSHGLEVEVAKTGNWRRVHPYERSQDVVVARRQSS